MARFMSSHALPPGAITREQLDQFARAAQEDPAVRGYRSFINLSEGKIVCVMEAESPDQVTSWFQKMGLPCQDLSRVELEGERGNIRPL